MSSISERPQVLLVDDNPQILKSLTLMLELMGWSVATATDFSQALILIQKRDFSLAILDFNMPQVNGLELCSMMRDLIKGKYLIIFILSGYIDSKYNAEIEKSSADAILFKPLGLNELKDVFKKFCLHCEL